MNILFILRYLKIHILYRCIIMRHNIQACQQESGKKSENCLSAIPRVANPAEHVSWGFLGAL